MYSFLSHLKGKVIQNTRIAPYTWLKVGGKCKIFFIPYDNQDLKFFLQNCNMDYKVIGNGSNILVRDNGFDGAIIKINNTNIVFNKDKTIVVDVSVNDKDFAMECAMHGISGFEFLYTIPGTIGGALKTNAGCYGSETADRLIKALAVDKNGNEYWISKDDLQYSYRTCIIDKNIIFLKACFQGVEANKESILNTMKEYEQNRLFTQPVGVKTGGSIFKNPLIKLSDGTYSKTKAWELIKKIGYAGKVKGGAKISDKHCNFFTNEGNATAFEFESLCEEIRILIKETFNIELEWEIERIGS